MIARTLFALLSALALASCTAGGPGSTLKPPGTAFATSPDAVDASVILASTTQLMEAQDYRVAPLDVLEITVFQVAELDTRAQVNSVGAITMPLIGQVPVAGRTTSEIEAELARRLGATYLRNPRMTVTVAESKSQRVTVDGAVRKPGIFPVEGDVSLQQAIALAEGLAEVADPSGVFVFRNRDGRRDVARFDLTAIRRGNVDDPQLQAGDIVMVDESGLRTVLRDLRGIVPIAGLFRPLMF